MNQDANASAWRATYDIWLAALDNTYRELIQAGASIVPGLIGAALLLLVGWLIAISLRALIVRFGTGVDRLFHAARDRVGQSHLELRWPISRILAHAVYWLVIVFFLAAAAKVLGLPGLVDVFAQILLYLPLMLVWAGAGLVLYMASGLVAGAVTSGARSAGLSNATRLGRVARLVAITFAGIIVIGQVGVDVTLLVNVVTISIAAFLGGAALAFGIGAGGVTRNFITAHYVRQSYRVGERVAVGDHEGEILEITRSAVILDTGKGRTMVPARVFNEQVSVLMDSES